MGFRVDNKSTFTFETDLPPSSRNIHPSGILHAFRSTPTATTTPTSSNTSSNGGSGSGNNNSINIINREEHTFAWIANSLHIESALSHLEQHGFDRYQGIIFIPYSSKRNWCDRYPHAEPALECTVLGKCIVHIDERPYPNGLGLSFCNVDERNFCKNCNGNSHDDGGAATTITGAASTVVATAATATKNKNKKRKRSKGNKPINILRDNSYLPDAERDELHVEIYNYLAWLHAKLAELERKSDESMELPPENTNEDEVDHNDQKKQAAATKPKNNTIVGVDVTELKCALDKLESTFAIIPNIKLEQLAIEAEEMTDLLQPQKQQQGDEQPCDEEAGQDHQPQQHEQQQDRQLQSKVTSSQKGPPFLEEALSKTLTQLVEARELAGKPKRRSRKRHQERSNNNSRNSSNPNRQYQYALVDFDELFQRLLEYKEEHGDCLVPKRYPKDQQLGSFVKDIRYNKTKLTRRGLEFEEEPPYPKRISGKLLTAERVQRLNSIGFVWNAAVGAPKMAWEDHFQECVEYYEMHGKWPTQSMGTLGLWVHSQRQRYSKRDANYMKTKAPKLDEVGFEWTPRGNTRMSWEEGFEMLMNYGRSNGHYNIPCPSTTSEEVDKKSDAFRLYNWVKSLHTMYRSYKLGRQHGSLTDARVVLLIKHGFVFQND